MPKVNVERNTFVKGLITEASPLTFPENASIEENNFVLNRDGSRQRRRGMDYEDSFVLLSAGVGLNTFSNWAITGYRWENVANDPTQTFCVVQVGSKIWFLDGFKNTLSANVLGSITTNSIAAQYQTQFAHIHGDLIAVNRGLEYPIVISYDGTTFTSEQVYLRVRDIWGTADTQSIGERLATITKQHEYNLFNQGWPLETRPVTQDEPDHPEILHTWVKYAAGVYPSNSDIWHLAVNSEDNFNVPSLLRADIGARQAPRGRNLLDPFNRGQFRRDLMDNTPATIPYYVDWGWVGGFTRDSALIASTNPTTDIELDKENGALSTVASYFGRVFYSGIDSDVTEPSASTPYFTGTVFFSQIVNAKTDIGKCYSHNDPTSAEFSDVLATDGGTITIVEASRIFKLVSTGSILFVFAENGVWAISGRDGIFTADDFSVTQISNIGAINAESVIAAEDNIYYWTKAGIYILSRDPTSNNYKAQNITETTIQTLYTSIPSVGRSNATGRYDSDSRKISWLYNDSESYNGVTYKNKYNKELVLDTVLQAFYTHSIGAIETTSSYVAGYIPTGGFNVITEEQQVVVNDVPVQVNGVNVVISTPVRTVGQSSTKYIAIKPSTTPVFTFSLYNNDSFLDWERDDTIGVDAAAYLITGYELFQDTARKKQIPYLTMHLKRTEDGFVDVAGDLVPTKPSSCLVRAYWDFANSSASGKWGTQFQAYRMLRNYIPTSIVDTFDYGQSVITTKSKLRGIGRALSLRIDTEAGKDCHLYGWSLSAEGGQNV